MIEVKRPTDLPNARMTAMQKATAPVTDSQTFRIPWRVGSNTFYTHISSEFLEWCRDNLRGPVQFFVACKHSNFDRPPTRGYPTYSHNPATGQDLVLFMRCSNELDVIELKLRCDWAAAFDPEEHWAT